VGASVSDCSMASSTARADSGSARNAAGSAASARKERRVNC
jgi:hypothetical protein